MSALAPRPLRSWAALILALCALSTGAPARAQEPAELEEQIAAQGKELPVAVSAQLGVASGRSPRRGFCLVQVDLTSRQDAQEVRIVVRPHDEDTPLLTLGPVTLEPGVPRRARGLAPARLINQSATLLFEVYREGTLVGIGLANAEPASPQLLIFDRRNAPPVDLSKLQTRGAGASGRELGWTPATLGAAEDLPESALAYSGVGAVLLGDLEVETWSEAQARALTGWVDRGGHLVISLDPQSGALLKSPLGRALGPALEALPQQQAPIAGDQVDLSPLLAELGVPPHANSERPPTLAPLSPTASDAVLFRDAAERPVVLTRRLGRGRLTLVAADLWAVPFKHSPATRALLERVLDGDSRFEPRARWLFPKLAEIRQPTQVGPAFALLIVFAMIAGPGIYFFLRSKKRGILLWLAIPGLTILFSAVVPFYRLALKDAESTLVGVRLIEGVAGSAHMSETIDVLLFSGSLEAKRVELQGGDATAFAVTPPRLNSRGRGAPGLGQALGSAGSDGVLRFELPVALWGARYFSCERSARRRPIEGAVTISEGSKDNRISLTLTYPGPLPLKGAVLVIPVRDGLITHPLPDLTMGQTYSAKALERSSPRAGDSKKEGLATLIQAHLVAGFVAKEALATRKAFLVGSVEAPPPVRAERNIRTRAFATLLKVELPLRFEGGLPFGHLKPRRRASTIASIGSASVRRQIVDRYPLPEEARQQAVERLTLRISQPPRRAEHSYEVRAGETWIKLDPALAEPEDSLDGIFRLALPDPARFVSPAGDIVIRQTFVRPVRAGDSVGMGSIDLALGWGGSTEEPGGGSSERPSEPEDEVN